MKRLKFILLLAAASSLLACDSSNLSEIPAVPAENEIVMKDGMQITATNAVGTITITADKGLKRSYTWEGATRSVIMWPREKRWFGSMGLYFPGPGNHWKEHNGIRRGVLEEGQQHFDSVDSALEWLRMWDECIYRDDGLVVCYSKWLDRVQLNVKVWQVYIGGRTPSKFQESVKVDGMNWTDKQKKRYKDICYVGGQKPDKLPGSRNNMIKVKYLSDK